MDEKQNAISLDKFIPRENMIGKNNPAYRHGMAGTPIYKLWSGIVSRCYNPKVAIYKYYGGRGILMCDRWYYFENFYSDMGDRPDKKQIDRIDNSKGYSLDNCRWVSAKENNPSNKGDLPDSMPGKRFGRYLVLHLIKHKPNHIKIVRS